MLLQMMFTLEVDNRHKIRKLAYAGYRESKKLSTIRLSKKEHTQLPNLPLCSCRHLLPARANTYIRDFDTIGLASNRCNILLFHTTP